MALTDNLMKKCLKNPLSDKPHENNRRYLQRTSPIIRQIYGRSFSRSSNWKVIAKKQTHNSCPDGKVPSGAGMCLKGFNGMTVDVGAVQENTLTGYIAALKAPLVVKGAYPRGLEQARSG